MKAIKCDFCGKEIELKEGELFLLEIQKVKNLERYPHSEFLISKDLCKKCLKNIKFLIFGEKK